MPIYKANGKKDGLQKYNVRINYLADSGEAKQLTRVAYGLDVAKNLEWELNQKIKNKDIIPVSKMTVKQLFDKYIATKEINLKKSSIAKMTNDFNCNILLYFGDYLIDKITINMLIEWQKDLKSKNLSLSTLKKVFSEFKAMFNHAIKCEYIQKSPFKNLDNFRDSSIIKKEMAYYTAEEFLKFLNIIREIAEEKEKTQNDLSEWNYYVFFAIAFYTGARKGEIHALRWTDIDDTILHIRRSLNQKFNEETAPKTQRAVRALQIPQPLIDILNEHKKRVQRLGNFIEDSYICRGIKDTTIERRNKFYAEKAGLKKIRIHDFRHSHASYLANAGILISEISRRLGHAKIEITWNIYCHLYPQEEERAIAVLNIVT